MDKITQSHEFGHYLNITPNTDNDTFMLMGAGWSQLDQNYSAQVTSKRYINDKSATKRISSYDFSAPYSTDLIRTKETVAFIYNIAVNQLTGEDAETDYIMVELDNPTAEGSKSFVAYKRRVAVEVSGIASGDGDAVISGNLQGIGDPIKGTATIGAGTVTFVPDEAAAEQQHKEDKT